jgi:hypothetical protein
VLDIVTDPVTRYRAFAEVNTLFRFTAADAENVVAVMRSMPEAEALPLIVQALDPVRVRVALAYWATVRVPVRVTPAPAVRVTTPAPIFRMRSVV